MSLTRPPAAATVRRRLLAWYERSARPLPWRRDADPFRVWVAETMLQQTTMAAVEPRYEDFLRRFPDVRALARARQAHVLRAWAGLGYYARARNLHAAARRIAARPGGDFPRDHDAWLALPGVGRYTAAAVSSIAFGRAHAVLDGNVARVLCRLFAIRSDARRPATRTRLAALAQGLLDPRRPGDWNQAVMELGEVVCTPKSPACGACPWRGLCAARKAGLQSRLPVLGPRAAPQDLSWTCLWIERRGRVLLWKRGRKELLLKGHWGLPEAGRFPARVGARLKTLRHPITRYRLALCLRRARLLGPRPPQARWVERARLKDFLISSLWLKLIQD
ncbi:MAG: A/G-specific adenine glycosylase [Elusimicrobia bacterium]|nr:A/G-specific adenine glycosylase [Elusimicrobiota bacterium]